MSLTKREIDQLKCADRGGKRFRVADGHGLYIEVMPSGSKFWRHRSQSGSGKWVTLGEYPYMSILEAREKNFSIKKKIHAGELEEKKDQLPRRSFQEVAEEWLEKKEAKSLAVSEKNKQIPRTRLQKNVFPFIGHKQMDDITAAELREIISRIDAAGHTETARRVLFLLQNVFRYAFASGDGTSDPTGVLRGLIVGKPVRHFPSIQDPKQIGHLMRTIAAYPHKVVRLAMTLQAYTFVRPGELRHSEWKEFDLHNFEWRIPAHKMKNKKQHLIPLSSQAAEVIREIEPITGHGRYVFPSNRTATGARPMSDATVTAALRTMGFSAEEMTGHGFRSMASTRLNESGLWSVDAIERQLAHQEQDSVRAAYNYAEYLPERRRMMQWWADCLDGLRDRKLD